MKPEFWRTLGTVWLIVDFVWSSTELLVGHLRCIINYMRFPEFLSNGCDAGVNLHSTGLGIIVALFFYWKAGLFERVKK